MSLHVAQPVPRPVSMKLRQVRYVVLRAILGLTCLSFDSSDRRRVTCPSSPHGQVAGHRALVVLRVPAASNAGL